MEALRKEVQDLKQHVDPTDKSRPTFAQLFSSTGKGTQPTKEAVQKAEKGNAVVIQDTSDYIKKVNRI